MLKKTKKSLNIIKKQLTNNLKRSGTLLKTKYKMIVNNLKKSKFYQLEPRKLLTCYKQPYDFNSGRV